MKLNVTHSTRPCAASVRRASATRCCRGVSVAGGTGATRGSETGGTASRPRRRSTSSTRSHSGSISAQPSAAFAASAGSSVSRLIERDGRGDVVAPGRHRDGDLVRVAALHREAEAFQRGDRLVRRNVGTAKSGDAREAHRRVALPGRVVPASVTAPGSPPHRSRIIAVAASIASGISAGSMPRSNRWRASDTI